MIKKLVPIFDLIYLLTCRDILSRYKGSVLGFSWSFINPIVMILIYTLVFSYIFKVKIGLENESKLDFAIFLFIGIIIVNFFNETITKSSILFHEYSNLIKKNTFPYETLVFSSVLSCFFHLLINFIVLIFFLIIFKNDFHLFYSLTLILYIPLLIISIGVSLIISALSVYFKDISQITSFTSTLLLFGSPVFYTLNTVPEKFRDFLFYNPLTYIIESSRKIILYNQQIDFLFFLIFLIFSFLFLWLCFFIFNKLKKGFVDAL